MARLLTRSPTAPPTFKTGGPARSQILWAENQMGILLVIVFVTLGLALRAVTINRRANLSGLESVDVTGVVDAHARTVLLVLLCLVGLFLLGLVHGDALGASASP
jgi:hypothetical protein